MSRSESYFDKTFIVESDDARIRKPAALMEFVQYGAGRTRRQAPRSEISSAFPKTRKSKSMR